MASMSGMGRASGNNHTMSVLGRAAMLCFLLDCMTAGMVSGLGRGKGPACLPALLPFKVEVSCVGNRVETTKL